MSTYDRPEILAKTLASIFAQRVPFAFEVIVVDDGGPHPARAVCRKYPVFYFRIDRPPGYRNPAVARNLAYKLARGRVLICQSDDVMHGDNAILRLVWGLRPNSFLLAKVCNVDCCGNKKPLQQWPQITELTGPANCRPLFFLGAVRRADVYAIGGCDEEFIEPGYEDQWFSQCLIRGRGLQAIYSNSAAGWHQEHGRPADLLDSYRRSDKIFAAKVRAAAAGDGPWRGGDPWPRGRGKRQ